MSVATREEIMDALLAVLQADATVAELFPAISRRFMMWEQFNDLVLTASEDQQKQPALFLYDGVGLGGGMDEFERPARGTPARVIMKRTIVIYAKLPQGGTPAGPDDITPSGSVFHPLIEAVIGALAPDSEGALTLGGLVSHCWIEGTALIMGGELDPNGQGMATIPVSIMMYPSL